MSNQSEEGTEVGVPDEALPDDLVPGEDNPLAEGLPAGEKPHDVLEDGKEAHVEGEQPPEDPDEAGDSGDSDGSGDSDSPDDSAESSDQD